MISEYGIADIEGLAEILVCSKSTIQKRWREYPHFFVGLGKTAKSARFNVDQVLRYLKEKESSHGISRSENEKMGRGFKSYRMSAKKAKRVQNQKGSQKMGNGTERKTSQSGTGTDPIENFRSMFNIPETL